MVGSWKRIWRIQVIIFTLLPFISLQRWVSSDLAFFTNVEVVLGEEEGHLLKHVSVQCSFDYGWAGHQCINILDGQMENGGRNGMQQWCLLQYLVGTQFLQGAGIVVSVMLLALMKITLLDAYIHIYCLHLCFYDILSYTFVYHIYIYIYIYIYINTVVVLYGGLFTGYWL